MASNFLFFHMALALATISAVHLEPSGATPAVHVISAVEGNSSQINIRVIAGGSLKGSAQLSPGQSYQFDAGVINNVYYATAIFGLRFTAFHAYEPARDIGRAAVYWKADMAGFSLSYDNVNWKELAPWESE